MVRARKNIYIVIIVAVVLALLGLGAWQMWKKEKYCMPEAQKVVENFELLEDDYGAAPSDSELAQAAGVNGEKLDANERSMYGYKYRVPDELPSVQDLLPEESACDSYWDPEAATQYLFNSFPMTSSLLNTRLSDAADLYRGDIQGVVTREDCCDFKPIYDELDTHLHGAFSDYTRKSHEIVGCKNNVTGHNDKCGKAIWTRDAPIQVVNEEIIMDY